MDNSKNNFDPDLSNPVGVTHIATSVIMIIKLTDTVYFTDPLKISLCSLSRQFTSLAGVSVTQSSNRSWIFFLKSTV